MHVQEIVWWGYTAFVALLALFMIAFTLAVREKGG